MIEINEENVFNIPVLNIAESSKRSTPLPTIFFFQRYTCSKELDIGLGYILAKAGFRVLFPEAPHHGARFNGDKDARRFLFWDILKQSIDELPLLYEHYLDNQLILNNRIGIAGTSLGGFIVLGAMAKYDWIKAGACYMGSGYFLSASKYVHPPVLINSIQDKELFEEKMLPLANYDISHHIHNLGNRPLFVWHGAKDDIVNVKEAIKLKNDLESLKLDKQLVFFIDEQSGHKINLDAMEKGVDFFTHNL